MAISHLPWGCQRVIGKSFGSLMYKVAGRRRHIAQVNLEICYPSWTQDQRDTLVKQHFQSMGVGFFETLCSWFRSPKMFAKQTTFIDHGVVEKLLSQNKGCILIGGHFSSLDLCGTLLAGHIPVHPVYKLQSNPVINWAMEHKRNRVYEKTIERTNMREVIKSLKNNRIVWYAVDQDYGRRHSVFAPFFNRECATIAHVGRIIKMTGAPVMAFNYARTEMGYSLTLEEVKNFPADDEVAAATLMNQLMEGFIASKKEQYFWTHRRFKTQQDPNAPSPYRPK